MQVAPSQDAAEQAQPRPMTHSKVGRDSHRFVVCEEAMFGNEGVPLPSRTSSAGCACRLRTQPGTGTSCRANHRFAGVAVLPQHHRHGVVRCPGLTPGVNEEQERSAEQPSHPRRYTATATETRAGRHNQLSRATGGAGGALRRCEVASRHSPYRSPSSEIPFRSSQAWEDNRQGPSKLLYERRGPAMHTRSP